MKAILVFIDGTICDTRRRHSLIGMPGFYDPARILQDRPVPGSIACLNELSRRYKIVYIGARPESASLVTQEWLDGAGFPEGALYLSESQAGSLSLVKELMEKFDFIAGIGDRWDDNELHAEIGCLSIILQEYEGKWGDVVGRIEKHHLQWRIETNRIHLQGKVEGWPGFARCFCNDTGMDCGRNTSIQCWKWLRTPAKPGRQKTWHH
jgi:hypothetical protein